MDAPDNARKQSEKNVIKLRAYSLLTGIIFILFQCILWSSETPGLKALGFPGVSVLCCGVLPIICLILTPTCGFFGSNNHSKCLLITYLTCNICGIIGNLVVIGLFSAIINYAGFFTADCEGVLTTDCIYLSSPLFKMLTIGTIFFALFSLIFQVYGCYLSCKTFNNPYFGHEVIYQGGLPISVHGAVPAVYYANPTYVQGVPTVNEPNFVQGVRAVTEPTYMPKTTINGYAPVTVYSQPSPDPSL